MLVLSRKINESIVIGDDVVVTIVDIRGDKVRLGITAPRDVPVHREEVYQLIHCQEPKSEGSHPDGSIAATEQPQEGDEQEENDGQG